MTPQGRPISCPVCCDGYRGGAIDVEMPCTGCGRVLPPAVAQDIRTSEGCAVLALSILVLVIAGLAAMAFGWLP